jgi:hypothetical protein
MEKGGLVIAAAGYFQKGPLESLMASFDLDIGSEPIGPIPLHRTEDRVKLGVEYIEAWPVDFTSAMDGRPEKRPEDFPFSMSRAPEPSETLAAIPKELFEPQSLASPLLKLRQDRERFGPAVQNQRKENIFANPSRPPVLHAHDFRPALRRRNQSAKMMNFKVYGAFRNAPLAVLKRVGTGGFFLVGDTYFFHSGNMEDNEEVSVPNIMFLKTLLDDFESWETNK